jgi:hypothetical protein
VTEITRTHAEWAVVDRLHSMLKEAPHAEYNVTQSYGFCVAILAWVLQRIRTPEGHAMSPEDRAAISVKHALAQQKVAGPPWGLKAGDTVTKGHGDFEDFTAFEFLKWLRDASCHGDARQISPVNKGGSLIGFEFQSRSWGDDRKRSLILTQHDLRRIGCGLAEMYCEALQSAAPSAPSHFVQDARSMRESRKAA